jgi:uncharacterized membrane-anchored protein YhcB (DUF1043 family)
MNLENRGNANINSNQEKIGKLDQEVSIHMNENITLEKDIKKYTKEQEKLINSSDKLVKLKQS